MVNTLQGLLRCHIYDVQDVGFGFRFYQCNKPTVLEEMFFTNYESNFFEEILYRKNFLSLKNIL